MRGRIAKRGNSYRVVVDVGMDPKNGKRKQHTETHRLRKDAERRLAELIQQANNGAYVKPAKLTVAIYFRKWLEDYAQVNTRPRTFENYRSKMELHIIPTIGHLPLAGLRADHLQGLYRDLLAKPLSGRTVLHTHRAISNALNHAVRWQLVGRNVAQAVTPPRPKPYEVHALEPQDLHRILQAAKSTPYHTLLHLLAFTGLRRSEALGLRWQDVDLQIGTLRIVQALHELVDGSLIFQEPKTASGRRSVPLSQSALFALKSYKERAEATSALGGETLSPGALVFSMPDGAPMKPRTVTQAFTRIARHLGIKVRLHDLRHTHASILLLAGVHPKAVQERLGHANIGITMDTYSHLLAGVAESAAQSFEDAVGPDLSTANP